MLTHQVLRDLAAAPPKPLVVSVHVRTDPRDRANTSSVPAWLIELRNGLATISDRIESSGERAERLAFRELRPRIEHELLDLSPAERARSVTWILDTGGNSQRFSLQLPLRGNKVVVDTKPFVSPLVDIADRGAPTGVILASGDLVRLVQIEQAEATEPENSTFELTLGDWRPFGGSSGGSPARGVLTTSHAEQYEARVEAQRDRLFDTAAAETAKRLEALRWERIVLALERQVAPSFRDSLLPKISQRVIATADLNLVGEEPAAIADTVEPLIEEFWFRHTTGLVEQAYERGLAGGPATLGAPETLSALVEGRVHHLILDPEYDFSYNSEAIPAPMRARRELIGERAVETAITTSASVSVLPATESPTLRDAGGMVALLRY